MNSADLDSLLSGGVLIGGPQYQQLQEQWRRRADADQAWKAELAWNDWNPDFVRHREAMKREMFLRSVSRGWLNAMLDVELGIGDGKANDIEA